MKAYERHARTVGTKDLPTSSTANLGTAERSSSDEDGGLSKSMSSSDAKIHRRILLVEKLNAAYTGEQCDAERLVVYERGSSAVNGATHHVGAQRRFSRAIIGG